MSELTKRCHTCKEKILKSAIKCKHCESYQNIFKYQNQFGFILIILTLIISAITLFYKLDMILETLNTTKSANIKFEIIDSDKNNIKVLIANNGNEPAVIKHFALSTNIHNNIPYHISIPFKAIIIKPKEYKIETLLPYNDNRNFMITDIQFLNEKIHNCNLTMNYMQLNNKDNIKSITFKCIPNKEMQNHWNKLK